MGQTLNSKRKLCTVEHNGPIPELGGIRGPILAPCQLSMRSIINLVQNGKRVYEVNPKKRTEKVRLTIKNVQKNNFPEPERFIMPKEEKAPEKPVVVKNDQKVTATQDNITAKPENSELDNIVKKATMVESSSTVTVEAAGVTQSDVVEHHKEDKPWKNKDNKGKSDFNKK